MLSFLHRSFDRIHGAAPTSVKEAERVPLLQYLQGPRCKITDVRPRAEAQTLLEALGFLIKGRHQKAADLLAMRFYALEFAVSKNNEWKEAKDFEVRKDQLDTLAGPLY